MTHHMVLHSILLHSIVRWLDFVGMIVLVGGIVFRYLVFQPGLTASDLAKEEMDSLGKKTERYNRAVIAISFLLLIMTLLVDFVLRSQMISKRPLFELPSIFYVILFKTHFGWVWMIKFILLVSLGMIGWQKRPLRGISLGLSGLFCLTYTLSGHAANRSDFSPDVLADWFHLLAVSAWIGGLIQMRLLMPRLLISLNDETAHRLLTRMLGRFSTLAGICVGILIPAGVLSVRLRGVTLDSLTETPYGRILAVKLLVVLPVLGLGALSRYYILPNLRSIKPPFLGNLLLSFLRNIGRILRLDSPGRNKRIKVFLVSSIQSQFFLFITVEFLLAMGVLLFAAILTQTPPPHQMGP